MTDEHKTRTTQTFASAYIEYLKSAFLSLRVILGITAMFSTFIFGAALPAFVGLAYINEKSLVDAAIILGSEVLWIIFVFYPVLKYLDDRGHVDRIGERVLLIEEGTDDQK